MSAAYAFEIERKQGDTEPWVFQVQDPRIRSIIALTGVTAKIYVATTPDWEELIDGATCAVDEPNGTITYNPVDDDVDITGEYEIQIELTLASGKTRTYPTRSQGRGRLRIDHAIGGAS